MELDAPPNPRYEITHLHTSKKLSELKPPKVFGKYKNYAVIDRLPSVYLTDLVTVAPKYYNPWCGKFYTFGWCSEREMSFNALLMPMGYDCKIKQEGIHTVSEIRVPLLKNSGKTVYLVAVVDNTFNTLKWQKAAANRSDWAKDYGKGTHIRWYNTQARSKKETDAVSNITVPDEAAERIKKQVARFLEKKD